MASIFYKNDLAGYLAETDEGEYLFQHGRLCESISGAVPTFSIPVRRQPYKSSGLFPFFEGLLPEGWLLDPAVKESRLSCDGRRGLLLACCEHSVGVVSVKPINLPKLPILF